jgi:hypothetical protein
MVTTDRNGIPCAIKNKIKQGIIEGENEKLNKDVDINELIVRLGQIRSRLEQRICGLPDDNTLRNHLRTLDSRTLRTLVVSGSWDTFSIGGEEVDVDWLFEEPDFPHSHEITHSA